MRESHLMFGIKMLGSGREYFKRVKAGVDIEREKLMDATPISPRVAGAPSPVKPAIPKLRFVKIQEANKHIEKLEAELAKRGTTAPPPTRTAPRPPTAPPSAPKPAAVPLPSWRECAKDFSAARQSLAIRLNTAAGCDFASEIIEASGLTGATDEAKTSALLAALWIAGDGSGPSATPAPKRELKGRDRWNASFKIV